MKKYILTLSFFLLFTKAAIYAQLLSAVPFTHTHVINNDTGARPTQAAITAATASRVATQAATAAVLSKLAANQQILLNTKYGENSFDNKNAFITQAAATTSFALGSTIAGNQFGNGHYMTKNKREFMNDVTLDKAMLATLQIIDYDNIAAGRRQEIYRLRNEIVKGYSENDAEVLKLLLIPAARYGSEGDAALSTIIKTLSIVN